MCATEISYHVGTGDNWLLEMLCNLGAAEVLMPVGSGLQCPANVRDFSQLLDLRKKYKVSTEALLLRMARLCNLQVFAASVEAKSGRPAINYVVSSAHCIPAREGARCLLYPVSTALEDQFREDTGKRIRDIALVPAPIIAERAIYIILRHDD